MRQETNQGLLDSDTGTSSDESYHKPRSRPPSPPPPRSNTTLIVIGMMLICLVALGGLAAWASSQGLLSFSWPTTEATSVSPGTVTVTEKPTAGGAAATPTARPTSRPTDVDEEHPAASLEKTPRPGGLSKTTNTDDSSPTTTGPAPKPTKTGTGSIVAVPEGATELKITFDSYTGGSVEEYLASEHQMSVSDWSMGMSPIVPQFHKDNVAIKDGILELKCLAKLVDGKVSSAEVGLQNDQILYAHFTTRAKATSAKGVCHGFFYYLDDKAEIDIEILTSYITEGLENGIQAGLWFTNHGEKDKSEVVPYPWDPAADFHDYTVIWTEDATEFLLDGVSVAKMTESVPQRPGSLVWNNWSSGDPQWSAGPPTEDNVLQIQSITGYYFTA